MKISLYEKVYNSGLGNCHLLQKKKGGYMGEIYLFYSENSAIKYFENFK